MSERIRACTHAALTLARAQSKESVSSNYYFAHMHAHKRTHTEHKRTHTELYTHKHEFTRASARTHPQLAQAISDISRIIRRSRTVDGPTRARFDLHLDEIKAQRVGERGGGGGGAKEVDEKDRQTGEGNPGDQPD
jgi:hypothetical protein